MCETVCFFCKEATANGSEFGKPACDECQTIIAKVRTSGPPFPATSEDDRANLAILLVTMAKWGREAKIKRRPTCFYCEKEAATDVLHGKAVCPKCLEAAKEIQYLADPSRTTEEEHAKMTKAGIHLFERFDRR